MNVILYGKNTKALKPLVKHTGFTIVETNPDFIISYGGDGTLMRAESLYPGTPKILLKDSLICKKCSTLPNEEVLKKVISKEYSVEEFFKIEASAHGKTVTSFNDIILRNKDPRHAMRYTVQVNGKQIGRTIIGDGIVVATPFGSTGYYRSITDSFFEIGIGLAFNNSIEQSDHVVLRENSTIEVEIIRGPAVVYADNQQEEISLDKNSRIRIKKSAQKAYIIVPNT